MANSLCYTSDEVKETPSDTEPSFDFDSELRLILTRKENNHFWVEKTLTSLQRNNLDVKHILGLLKDLTCEILQGLDAFDLAIHQMFIKLLIEQNIVPTDHPAPESLAQSQHLRTLEVLALCL